MDNSKRPMRRSALIGPWGVGAIVPFPNDESLMIAGLDAWEYTDSSVFRIKDERLEKRLGVKELRWPPDFREKKSDPKNYNLSIPAVRFPLWHYCPFCGSMKKAAPYGNQPKCDAFQWETGRVCKANNRFRRLMIPERFVVICPEGHIDDFPVAEWLHSDGEHVYKEESCRIRRSTGGSSAALSGVYYECTCGAKKSLSSAMRTGALNRIGYQCTGAKPWLGSKSGDCTADPEAIKVVLRGATNVWFSDTRSSIYIPTDDDKISKKILEILDKNYDYLSSSVTDGKIEEGMVRMLAMLHSVPFDALYKACVDRFNNQTLLNNVSEETSEEEYRLAEYKVLKKDSGSDILDFHAVNYKIEEYDSVIRKYFNSFSLVHKLRETRAFVGFYRVNPGTRSITEQKKELRLGNENWLPAIETKGEGIFFEFDKDAVDKWARKASVKNRVELLNQSYHNSMFGGHDEKDLNPAFVLIHTFAHLLINQLSFECGYGSSSIRERIYCEKTGSDYDMYGVLIYTASGDSEGSLGGLVRQGKPGIIEETIVNAVQNAAWCASDPVCIQSSGQGPESLNLAACHNCALLPETCCEVGNRLLDRGLLVGTLEDPSIGFFKELLENR